MRKAPYIGFQCIAFGHGVVATRQVTAKSNSEFAPENGWLEYDRYLLGFGLVSGANC